MSPSTRQRPTVCIALQVIASSLALHCRCPAPSSLQVLLRMSRWPCLLSVARIQNLQHGFLFVPFDELVAGHGHSHTGISASKVSLHLAEVMVAWQSHVQVGANSELLRQMPQSNFTCSLISSSVAFSAAVLLGPSRGNFGLWALSKILAM